MNVGFVYGAGLPYSAIPLSVEDMVNPASTPTRLAARPESTAGSPPLLPEPTRPYLRLDLSASRTWTTGWGNVPMEVAPYLRLLNTLGNRDALFYPYDRDEDESLRPLVVLPLIPVLGVEWKF